MSKANRIMYLIGLIFNVLEIVTLLVGAFALALAIGASDELFSKLPEDIKTQFADAAAFKSWLITGCVACIFGLLISVTILVLSRVSKKAQETGVHAKGWSIVILILGVFNNLFYFVAGILGLVEQPEAKPQEAIAQETKPAKQEVAPAKQETKLTKQTTKITKPTKQEAKTTKPTKQTTKSTKKKQEK